MCGSPGVPRGGERADSASSAATRPLATRTTFGGVIGWIDGYWLSNLRVYRETLASLASNTRTCCCPAMAGRTMAPRRNDRCRTASNE